MACGKRSTADACEKCSPGAVLYVVYVPACGAVLGAREIGRISH